MTHRVDPELVAPLQAFLAAYDGERRLDDIPAVRARASRLTAIAKAQAPPVEGVHTEDRQVPGLEGDPPVGVRIYRPRRPERSMPALLWIHGGGYVLGSIEADDVRIRQLAASIDCLIVSVEYRLAPEHPFPAPLNDCYAALRWLSAHAVDLGADPGRIAIGGASAGAGLAAGVALLARDRGEPAVAFQLLIYPMIDDRNVAPASASRPDSLQWTRENNLVGWRSYLGRDFGGDGVSAYAAVSRAADVSGLPPAFLCVGALDLFVNEDLAYAQRLIAAGISTELHVYPGAYHGFDILAPASAVSRHFLADRNSALRRALHGPEPLPAEE
jgi:acetyl esterase/lipase